MKRFFIVPILLIICFFTISRYTEIVTQEGTLEKIIEIKSVKEKGVLTIAVDENIPGYFNYNGCGYGFQYDILKEYAKSIDVELKIIEKKGIKNAINLLSTNMADIVVTMGRYSNDYPTQAKSLEPIYKTNYVVLAKRGNDKKLSTSQLKEIVAHKNIVLSDGFTATDRYNFWLDSIKCSAVISMSNTLDMISSISRGEIDYFVCEKMEATLGCFLNKDVREVYTFEEEVNSVLLVSSYNKALESDFNSWLEEYTKSTEYGWLHSLYHESGFLKQLAREGFVAPLGNLSPYDEIIKRESIKAGLDWRLVSAIAYHESRFNPTLSSPRKAEGIMQVMPAIARHFEMEGQMANPVKNIEVALKLINKIESSLKFSPSTSQHDRLCIILACYNGGIGHVLDARRLATKYGENPNSWSDVAKYLSLKSNEDFYMDAIVKSGKFYGTETLAFVSKVMHKYDSYCKIVNK